MSALASAAELVRIDVDEPELVRRALTPKTKAIFVESLANPAQAIDRGLSLLSSRPEIPYNCGLVNSCPR
jgi:O-acetylhomoserine/O-acetylserine sulfhydrylase-like pyridoxal-dependent enzyme